MNVTALVDQARELVNDQLLTDTGTIDRQGPPTIDPDTGEEIPSWQPVTDAPIPMLVQQVTRLATGQADSTGEPILITEHIAKVDVGQDVQPGDRITITVSHDPANTGAWTVSEVERQGWAITRRIHLERTWHSPSTPRS